MAERSGKGKKNNLADDSFEEEEVGSREKAFKLVENNQSWFKR